MAPKRVIHPTSSCTQSSRLASSSSSSSSAAAAAAGRHLSHHIAPSRSSPSKLARRQPILRFVQDSPAHIIQADLTNFRDIVHRFTGHQPVTQHHQQEEGTTKSIQNVSTKSLSMSPSSPSRSSSSSSSSASSSAPSILTTSSTISDDVYITHCSLGHDFQECVSILASWDGINSSDITSKLHSDRMEPFDHMIEFNNAIIDVTPWNL